VNLHVGDGIAVHFTGGCVIGVDPPGMLVFYPIPTPSNSALLHAVKPGRGALVVRASCNPPPPYTVKIKAQYTVTIVVS
jgi:hypothetical protein